MENGKECYFFPAGSLFEPWVHEAANSGTDIVSHLTARPALDLVRAAEQATTVERWDPSPDL